jgi:D-alanyl-D-alanine carboxypeptidase (penicillin-binding protein 5/6)
LAAAVTLLTLTLMVAFPVVSTAETVTTTAQQLYIMDADTGAVLMQKNANQPMVPSSMSKLMTLYMVFTKLKSGSWKMSDMLHVSERAWKKHYAKGESLMFLPPGADVSVSDLVHGVIVDSGNDACSVLAEAYAGTESAFAADETRYAHDKLGLTNSTFKNASGVPVDGHVMTARDLAVLARDIIVNFPEYYPIFAQKTFTYNHITQGNRNPLLWATPGADGLKTGHTEAGGYGLVGSVKRGHRRIILVANGWKTHRERWDESQRLINWAFREFDDYALFKKGDVVTTATVWLGRQETVPLLAAKNLVVTMPRDARPSMKVSAIYTGPIAAPIVKGQVVGKVEVTAPGITGVDIPLVAGADVAKLGYIGRIRSTVQYLLWGPRT